MAILQNILSGNESINTKGSFGPCTECLTKKNDGKELLSLPVGTKFWILWTQTKKKYTKKNKYRLTCHLSLTKDCSPLSDRVTDGQPQY